MDASRGQPVQVESWLRNWTFGMRWPPTVTGLHSRMPPAAANPVATFFGEKQMSG